MTEMYLVITTEKLKKEENIDFFLICHAACMEIGTFQWFLKNNQNDNEEQIIENQTYESFTTTSKWINDNAEGKWLGCHCLTNAGEHTELLGYLSSDVLNFLRNNTELLISISVSEHDGNVKYTFEKAAVKEFMARKGFS